MSGKLPTLTVNHSGKQAMAFCCFCKKNEVPIEQWNKRCPECKAKQKAKDEIEKQQIDIGIGKRIPAAVIEIESGPGKGKKIFVDKFGREVDNPGYDLENDPRGWRKTGTLPKKREMIT